MNKIAFLFSGQGSQYVGMGKELSENIKECKDIYDEADKTLGFSISNLCFNGPKEGLDITENTQPAILTTSIAALKALEAEGIKPYVTAGLSLGEYAALVCSGVFEFKDAVALVRKRGKYMQEAVPQGIGGMAAVIGLSSEKVIECCKEASVKGIIEVANFNCPLQIVISGEIEALNYCMELCNNNGAMKVVALSVSGPFHSSMLEPAAIKLEEELKGVEIKDMNIPVITNVTGDYIKDINEIKGFLKKQVMSSVYWEHTIKKMIEDGVNTFVEIGPGKVLSGFVKKIDRKLKTYNVEDMQSLNKTIEGLKTDMESEV